MADLTNEQVPFPRRLRRLQTVWASRGRPLFFVTFCTADRQPWLTGPEIQESFKLFCAQSPQQAGVWVGKYVLMPDHVHLFVSAEGSRVLSKWVGALKRNLAKARRQRIRGLRAGGGTPAHNGQDSAGNTQNGWKYGRAWQEGFFDHALRSSESYSEKWNYVRMNPVRAGLVNNAEDWPFTGEIDVLRW
ncbi:MAG: transposase [Kiritimatiellae bacterium]|nr:transposase [Kiritimatiellia bacterium]MDD4341251.1 transposase [Kiritimatiellia bacterium]